MAFALIFVGIMLTVSAVRETTKDLFDLVRSDFTGPGNFFFWSIAVLIVGSVGYIPAFRRVSQAFLVLIVIVLLLRRGDPNGIGGGLFSKFFNAFAFAGGQGTTILNPSNPGGQSVPAGQSGTDSRGSFTTLQFPQI